MLQNILHIIIIEDNIKVIYDNVITCIMYYIILNCFKYFEEISSWIDELYLHLHIQYYYPQLPTSNILYSVTKINIYKYKLLFTIHSNKYIQTSNTVI